MQFKGILHIKNSGKKEALLKFTSSGLDCSAENFKKNLAYNQLHFEIGGANNHLIFFKPFDKTNDFVIQLEKSKELLGRLKDINMPLWSQTIKKDQRANLAVWLIVSSILLMIMLILGYLFQSRSLIAAKIAESIPYETEQAIGERLISGMIPSSKQIDNPEVTKELNSMIDPLLNVIPGEFKIKFLISKESELNAYALPGGVIVINSGLLEKADSDEEVLGVVAHEIAHITKRHVIRSLIQGAGLFLMIQTLTGDFSGLIAILGDQGKFLISRSFSRDMEEEADLTGFDYLVKASINPSGLITFFKKIKAEHEKLLGKDLSQVDLSFFSSHPETEKRIEIIGTLIKNHVVDTKLRTEYLKKIQSLLKG